MFKTACILVLGLTTPLLSCAQSAVAGQPDLVLTKLIDSPRPPELFTSIVQRNIPHLVTAPPSASPRLSRSVPQSKSSLIKTSAQLFDSVNHQVGNASRHAPEPVFFLPLPRQEKQTSARTQTSVQATNKDKVMHQLRRLGFRFSRQGEVGHSFRPKHYPLRVSFRPPEYKQDHILPPC